MGLFDTFNPLTLEGAAQGMLAGREAKIALDQADADRAIRQQTANTLQVQARNEALAPFRAEIARQLQVHDQYRPFHQAGLMQQYGTPNASDPRVQSDMQAWDRTMDPYRQALATDDPDQVRHIMQNSLTQTGRLPPAAPPPPSPAPAPPPVNSADLSANGAGAAGPGAPPPPVSDLVQYVTQIPGARPDPHLIQDLMTRGVEAPELYRTPGDGLPPLGTPGNPRHGSAPPALAPAGSPGNPRHNSTAPAAAPPAPAAYKFPSADSGKADDGDDPSDDNAEKPPAWFKVPGMALPQPSAASTAPLTPSPSDPARVAAMQRVEQWLSQMGPITVPKPVLPPLSQPPGSPNPQAPQSQPGAPAPLAAYDPTNPNPVPGMAAGMGAPGSQNPNAAQGAPFLAQGPDGTPILRVPGAGDVPVVTAQRVVDQAQQDPGYVAAHKYADSIRLVSTLGPLDPAVIEKAVTAEGTAWNNALQRYGELDKMPTDQLNTLMTAYTGRLSAESTAARVPSQNQLDQANANKLSVETSLLAPKFQQDLRESLVRNAGMFHTMGLNDAQAQEALANKAFADANRLKIPQDQMTTYVDGYMNAQAAMLHAQALWAKVNQQDTLSKLKDMDPILGNAVENVHPAGGPTDMSQVWIILRESARFLHDPDAQKARNAQVAYDGALAEMQGASNNYYIAGHPETVVGIPPTPLAWRGYQLWNQYGSTNPFINKNDATSKQAVDAMREWTAYVNGWQGKGVGSYPKDLGNPGLIEAWRRRAQGALQNYQDSHTSWFRLFGQTPPRQPVVGPPAAAPGPTTPSRPSAAPAAGRPPVDPALAAGP